MHLMCMCLLFSLNFVGRKTSLDGATLVTQEFWVHALGVGVPLTSGLLDAVSVLLAGLIVRGMVL